MAARTTCKSGVLIQVHVLFQVKLGRKKKRQKKNEKLSTASNFLGSLPKNKLTNAIRCHVNRVLRPNSFGQNLIRIAIFYTLLTLGKFEKSYVPKNSVA